MSNPDVNVLLALAEAYLVERKYTWGIEVRDNGKLNLPTNDAWAEDKIDSFHKVLKQITKTNANSIDEWIALVFVIQAEQQKEIAKISILTFNHKLLDLYRAMRSYIVNSIKDEPDCVAKIKSLNIDKKTPQDEIIRLERFPDDAALQQANKNLNAIEDQIKALTIEDNFLTQFFNKNVVPSEKYKELKETDFKSFIESVKNGLRPADLCKQLLDTKNVAAPDDAVNNTTTAPASVIPALVAPNLTKTTVAPKPAERVSATKKVETSGLAKNSFLAAPAPSASATAPKAPRKSKGKAKPQPIPLHFSSESESPDQRDVKDITPIANPNRSTRSGKNY